MHCSPVVTCAFRSAVTGVPCEWQKQLPLPPRLRLLLLPPPLPTRLRLLLLLLPLLRRLLLL